MRKLSLLTLTALMAVNLGLYAQERETAQEEPKIKLELAWEKEIPAGVSDFVFLDENGYNVFSSQCKDPEKALRQKRGIFVQDRKLKWFEGDNFKVVKEMAIGEGSTPNGSKVVISKNGRNIAIVEGLERWDRFKEPDEWQEGFKDKPATLRLLNWKGEELARTQFSPAGWGYIDLYPPGNDKAVALNLTGSEGMAYRSKVFVRNGKTLSEVLSLKDACIWDYSENGSTVILSLLDVETQFSKERMILDGEAKIIAKYAYDSPRGNYCVRVSPSGNYIAEVTTGKYVVIHNRNGQLVKEHKIAGGEYGAFSPNEEFVCISQGRWRVNLFNVKNGNLLWEYAVSSPDSFSFFYSLVASSEGLVFAGSSRFAPLSVMGSAAKEKTILIFDQQGKIIERFGSFIPKTEAEVEFYSCSPTPQLRLTPDGKYLLVRFPKKYVLYQAKRAGGEQ